MKKFTNYLFLVFFAVIISSCSKKEEKLELFSAEAFAYSMDNGWELNATCRVKGFTQKEESEEYKAKLSFTVDIKTPDGKLLQGVGEGLIDKSEKEEMTDLPVETQIELDSTYTAGKYLVIFNLSDDLSGNTVSIQKDFELAK